MGPPGPGVCLPMGRGAAPSGGWARVLTMTGGLSQRAAVASRVERLVERAMAFAIDERDDDGAVARVDWLAQAAPAARDQPGDVCREHAESDLVVRARAAGLLARVRHDDLSSAERRP